MSGAPTPPAGCASRLDRRMPRGRHPRQGRGAKDGSGTPAGPRRPRGRECHTDRSRLTRSGRYWSATVTRQRLTTCVHPTPPTADELASGCGHGHPARPHSEAAVPRWAGGKRSRRLLEHLMPPQPVIPPDFHEAERRQTTERGLEVEDDVLGALRILLGREPAKDMAPGSERSS